MLAGTYFFLYILGDIFLDGVFFHSILGHFNSLILHLLALILHQLLDPHL